MKNRIMSPCAIYTILFTIIFGICFSPFLIRGNGLIHEADSFNQSYPVLIYMGNWIRNLLQGEFRLFDFSIGLGEDVITALNWHGFGDPFLLLGALLPEKYSECAYYISMILKFYFVGWAFLIYSKEHISVKEYRICGALLYTFSGFSLFWGLNCWMFLNPMITMPLLFKGMDELLYRRKKISYWLMGALFIQAMTGFYFFYMEIILSLFYFGVTFCLVCARNKERLFRERVSVIYWTFINGLLGGLSGAFILIPTIIGFIQSSRSSENSLFVSILDFFFYTPSYYFNNYRDLIIPNGQENVYTFSLMIVLGVLIAWCQWKEKNKSVYWWLSVIFFILFQIPFFGSLMNGFSYVTGRWYFALYFFAILLTMEEMQKETYLKAKQLLIYFGICYSSIIISLMTRDKDPGSYIRFCVFAFLVLVVPYVWKNRKKNCFLCFVSIMICVNALFLFGPKALGGSGYSAAFKKSGTVYEEIKAHSVDKHAENSFARADIYDTSWMGSLVNDFYGTTEYISMLNGNVSEFYQRLHIDPGVHSASWILTGLDGRKELQSLLSVSEYTDYEIMDGELADRRCENEKPIPFGCLFQDSMSVDRFEMLNPMEKETALLNYVILETSADKDNSSVSELKEFNREIQISKEFVGIKQELDRLVMESNGCIRLRLDGFNEYYSLINRKTELYVEMKDMILHQDRTKVVNVGNKTLLIRNSEDDYYLGSSDFWTNVTAIQEDDKGYYFDIRFPEGGVFTLGDIAIYSHTVDEKAIEQRAASSLSDLEIKGNKVSGTISIPEAQYLLVTIPYSDGWKAYVDGEVTPLYRVDIAFSAVFLEKGRHTITFRYTTPGLKLGIMISVISLMMIFLLSIYLRKNREDIEDMEISSYGRKGSSDMPYTN